MEYDLLFAFGVVQDAVLLFPSIPVSCSCGSTLGRLTISSVAPQEEAYTQSNQKWYGKEVRLLLRTRMDTV
jgi:hypothetical protein